MGLIAPSNFIDFGSSIIVLLSSSLRYIWISNRRFYLFILIGLSLLSSFYDVAFIFLYSFVSSIPHYTLLFIFVYLLFKVLIINTLNKHIATGLFSVSRHFTPLISTGLVNTSLLNDFNIDQINRFVVALNGIFPAECLTLVILIVSDLPAFVLQLVLVFFLLSPHLVLSSSLLAKGFFAFLLIVLFFFLCYLFLRSSTASARSSSSSLSSIFLYQRVLRSSRSEVLAYSLLQHSILNLTRLSRKLLVSNIDLYRGSQLSGVFLQAFSFMPLIFSIGLLSFASIDPLILMIVTISLAKTYSHLNKLSASFSSTIARLNDHSDIKDFLDLVLKSMSSPFSAIASSSFSLRSRLKKHVIVDSVSRRISASDRFGSVVFTLEPNLRSADIQYFVCKIVGPSGSGKSTFLSLLVDSLLQSISSQSNSSFKAPHDTLRLSVCNQTNCWLPGTMYDNVTLFGQNLFSSELYEALFDRDEIDSGLIHRLVTFDSQSPSSFSGGQFSRFGLLRALLNKPSVLILDEPFASLDVQRRIALSELLRAYSGSTTIIYTDHSNTCISTDLITLDVSMLSSSAS